MIIAMNMWSCLLLLCAQFAHGMTMGTVIWTQCPTHCSCTADSSSTSLVVDCQRRPDVGLGQLSDQFDSLLSGNLTYGRLMSLRIINSLLTHVPRSVCRLTTLTTLRLNYNRLARLPENCLTNLSKLTLLTASDNAIETLQNGVFDGLSKLHYLDLSRNRISSIGLSVFATSSNLSNLFSILLSANNLTSLEPWVYDRGLVGSFEEKVRIDLTRNKISTFTNKMRHTFLGQQGLCSREIPFANVDLGYNSVHHFQDILSGWNLSFKGLLSCYRINNGRINFLVEIKHNNIACDCVNYNFYRTIALQNLPYDWRNLRCNLTDPITKNTSVVNGYNEDLSLFVCELTERCPARCICFRRPANATLHVYCSNKNLTVLPLELPELPDSHTKYKLDFSNNRLLRSLEHRDYFVNTSILDVSNSNVDDVSHWEEIVNIPDLNLYGNKITSLSRSFLSINVTFGKLNLAGNPWDCSCDNKWMSDCFRSIADRLTQNVLCYSPSRLRGKNIIQTIAEDFCVDPASEAASKAVTRALTISMSVVAGVVAVLISVGVVLHRLRVKLYTRWKFHPFDREECLGEDMHYDVFLSCSTSDNLPHGNGIRQQLEQRGYSVCYPPRDFIAGASIFDNICDAVVHSKRTVCLLTEHFLQRFVPLLWQLLCCVAYTSSVLQVSYHERLTVNGQCIV